MTKDYKEIRQLSSSFLPHLCYSDSRNFSSF